MLSDSQDNLQCKYWKKGVSQAWKYHDIHIKIMSLS